MKTWRDRFRPIIARIISEVGKSDMNYLRKELCRQCPLHPKMFWPYKVWCDEINLQLGRKKRCQKYKNAEQNTRSLFDV